MVTPVDNQQPSLVLNQSISLDGVYPSRGGGGNGQMLGMVRTFGFNFDIGNFADGTLYPIAQNTALFSILGTNYGGDGRVTFGLPDLAGRVTIGAGQGPGLSLYDLGQEIGSASFTVNPNNLPPSVGGLSVPIENLQPSLAMNFVIQTEGIFNGSTLYDIGLITQFAGNFEPGSYMHCDGRLLQIAEYEALFTIIGTTYGGDGVTTFALPDLRGRTPIGAGQSPGLDSYALGEVTGTETVTIAPGNLPPSSHPMDNYQPSLAINYLIALQGIYPSRDALGGDDMEPYLGEIVMSAGNLIPRGFAVCDGSLLRINQNTALFSLLGTQFGGDGVTTFALPDLRGKAVVGFGNGLAMGQELGEEYITLTSANVPALPNAPPTANAGSASTNEDTALNGNVTGSDPESQPLTFALATGASFGTVVVNTDGSYTYTPGSNYHGTDSFTFTASDGTNTSAAATVNLTVTSVNDAPAGSPTAVLPNGTEDQNYLIHLTGLLNGFSDADGDAIAASNFVIDHGTLTGFSIPYFTITPEANYNGLVTIHYSVIDFQGGSTPATQTFWLAPVNDKPTVAATITSVTNEDGAGYSVNLLLGASDIDGDSLSVANLTFTGDASGLSLSGSTLTVDPSAYNHMAVGESEVVTYSYDVIDGNGGTVGQTATITIEGRNDVPELTGTQADLVHGTEDQTYALKLSDLLTGFTDPDGDALDVNDPFDITIQNAVNALVFDPSGNMSVQFLANFNGPALVSYKVSDGNGGTINATRTITIDPVNDNPTARNDTATVLSGGPRTIILSRTSLISNDFDIDGDSPLTLSAVGSAGNGTATLNDNGTAADKTDDYITYTPTLGFSGPDSFTYTISDGNGGTASAKVNITVEAVPPPATVYTAGGNGDDVIDKSAETVTQLIAGNGGNDTLSGGSANDSLNGGANNDILNGNAGQDTLTGGAGADQFFIDKADMPSGVDKIVDFQGAGNGDVAGDDKILLSGFSVAAQLSLVGHNNNIHTYKVTDGGFTGTFIAIYAGNAVLQAGDYVFTPPPPVTYNSPVAGDDTVTVLASGPRTISLSVTSLLANDTDADGDVISITGVGSAANGIATFFDNGTATVSDDYITYTPTVGYAGPDSFTYILSDGTSTDTGAVAITVQPATTGPTYTSGTAGDNVYNFSAATNVQLVNGQGGNDTVTGGSNTDTINGGADNDTLNGWTGKDTLTGGTGLDTFVFTSADNDKVVDFSVADDTFALSQGAFAGISEQDAVSHVLLASQFHIGAAASNGDQRVIYNSATGGLYYDADGNGVSAMVQIATLSKSLALTNDDFVVWA